MQASITFYVDGAPICTCHWWHVPRMGDEVILGRAPARRYLIVRVVWGVDPREAPAAGVQGVSIDLKPL